MTIRRRGGSGAPAVTPSDNIVDTDGDVLLDNVLVADGVSVNDAMFKPCEHTFWHSHEHGQIFFVKSGRGAVVTRDGTVHVMEPGDVLYTPPNEEHWHGASPDCYVQYTAASLGQTQFAEPVDPGDYKKAWG